MTESKSGLGPQARAFVAVGASVGAGCHPCLTHHLADSTGAGIGAPALLAAITAAERVTADASARMAQHACRQLPAQAESAAPGCTAGAAALAALGAAVAANSVPNIRRYLAEAARLEVSREELADAVNVARAVQQNAARIHARLTARLLDAPQEGAAGQAEGSEQPCSCQEEGASAGIGGDPAPDAAAPGTCGCDGAAAADEPPAASGCRPPRGAAAGTPAGMCMPAPEMLAACCAGKPA